MDSALEVIKLETDKELSDNDQKTMTMIKKYGNGDKHLLSHIYRQIKKRGDYLSELEMTLLQMEYQKNKLYGQITVLGERNVPITVKVLEYLIHNDNK